MERPTGWCHLSTISVHLQRTIKTASVSTSASWPSLINYCFICVSLWYQRYLSRLKNSWLIDWLNHNERNYYNIVNSRDLSTVIADGCMNMYEYEQEFYGSATGKYRRIHCGCLRVVRRWVHACVWQSLPARYQTSLDDVVEGKDNNTSGFECQMVEAKIKASAWTTALSNKQELKQSSLCKIPLHAVWRK